MNTSKVTCDVVPFSLDGLGSRISLAERGDGEGGLCLERCEPSVELDLLCEKLVTPDISLEDRLESGSVVSDNLRKRVGQ